MGLCVWNCADDYVIPRKLWFHSNTIHSIVFKVTRLLWAFCGLHNELHYQWSKKLTQEIMRPFWTVCVTKPYHTRPTNYDFVMAHVFLLTFMHDILWIMGKYIQYSEDKHRISYARDKWQRFFLSNWNISMQISEDFVRKKSAWNWI